MLDFTKPIKTREGTTVRILCIDRTDEYPIIGLISNCIFTWKYDGTYHSDGVSSKFDLIQDIFNIIVYKVLYAEYLGIAKNTFIECVTSIDNSSTFLSILKLTLEDGKVIKHERV